MWFGVCFVFCFLVFGIGGFVAGLIVVVLLALGLSQGCDVWGLVRQKFG